MDNIEIWRDIPGYEGLYQASNLGRIKSLPRCSTSGRELALYQNKRNGYLYVVLSKQNVASTKRVHRLVARAFWGDSELQVNHINGIKTDNRLCNLEYCTASENMKHAFTKGLEKVKGKPCIRLDTKEVFDTLTDAARSVGGRQGEMVNRVCAGKRSHYRNVKFAYLEDYQAGTIPEYAGKITKKASVALWR